MYIIICILTEYTYIYIYLNSVVCMVLYIYIRTTVVSRSDICLLQACVPLLANSIFLLQGEAFSLSNKVVLPCRQPGGWSARGQPCDAIHSVYRRFICFYTESSLGYRSSLLTQATSSPLLLSNGNPHHTVSHLDSVMASIYGWKRIAKNRHVLRQGANTRVGVHVWVSRGDGMNEADWTSAIYIIITRALGFALQFILAGGPGCLVACAPTRR